MLSHLTRGRALFGAGPGALPSDSWQMGLDPLENRTVMDIALGAIVGLLEGREPVTVENKWFTLKDARLQLLPFRREFDLRVAAMTLSAGPQACGKHGIGMVSVAATSTAGFDALKGAWGIAENAADEFGRTVDRSKWAVVAPMHIAETDEQARKDVEHGMRERLHYFKKTVPLPIGAAADNVPEAIDELASGTGLAVIGTPDKAIAQIERLLEQTGGFGAVLVQAHDWADPAATYKSYDLLSRYVILHFDGSLAPRVANYSPAQAQASLVAEEFGRSEPIHER